MESTKIEIEQKLGNEGTEVIVISVTKKGNRAIFLALVPEAEEPYLTGCYDESCCKAGHYFGDLDLATKDYEYRVAGGY